MRKFEMLGPAIIVFASLFLGFAQYAQGQTLAECDNAPSHVLVQPDGVQPKWIGSGDAVSVRITETDPSRHVSKIQFFVDGVPNLLIDGQRIQSFKRDGPVIYVPVTVSVGTAADGQLVLKPNSSPSVHVFVYDDQSGPQQGCGRTRQPIPFATRGLGPFAIVVGFNYNKSGYELRFAQNDAEAMVEHLRKHLHVAPGNIILFTDDPEALKEDRLPPLDGVNVAKPDHPSDIGKAFDTIYNRADNNSLVYFYFSGHEYVGPDDQSNKYTEQYYLLLWNSDVYVPESMYGRPALYKNLMAQETRKIGTIGIFDACYSGPEQPGDKSHPLGAKFMRSPYTVNPFEPTPSWGIRIFSSSGTELSWEFEKDSVHGDIRHGLFTFNLLEQAKNAAIAHKVLTLNEATTSAIQSTKSYQPEDGDIRTLYKEAPTWLGVQAAFDTPWVSQ